MNRKNLAMAALLGILFFAGACEVAWANPVFYARIDNRTEFPVKVTWHFSTRDGQSVGKDRVMTIPPHDWRKFWGPKGYGRFHYKFHTTHQGSSIKNLYVDAVTDPNASGARIDIIWHDFEFTARKQ